VAGADIRDCFYAVSLPAGLEQFFVLRSDLTKEEAMWVTRGQRHFDSMQSRFCPAIVVLPMGFSWSFYLVQHIHESAVLRALDIDRGSLILEGHPIPKLNDDSILSLPYCDNIHVLSTDKDQCNKGCEKVCSELRQLGFELHEEEEANLFFNTLGGTLNVAAGEVRPTALRAWRIMAAFEHIESRPVSGRTVQKLLGHAMFICVLNRAGMAIFRSLYDFVQRNIDDLDRLRLLNHRERLECRVFVGLVPMLFAALRRPWSSTVICSDASPQGFGLCEREDNISRIRDMARWHERWRFKRLDPCEWNPRRRAMGSDVVADMGTVLGVNEDERLLEQYVQNDDFPEIPKQFMDPKSWKTCLMGKWGRQDEHITLKEGRSLVLALRRLCRSSHNRQKRHLILVDNLSLAFCANKGRAHNFSMLRITQQLAALQLAGSFSVRMRWAPSELNVADGPSQGCLEAGALRSSCPAQSSFPKPSVASGEESGQAGNYKETVSCPSKRADSDEEAQLSGGEQPERDSVKSSISSSKHSEVATGTGSRCWQESAIPRYDHLGTAISQLGSSVPIPEVLSDVREFLPNLRCKMAPRERLRSSTGRSARCVVRGRQELQRRRKDCGFGGVLQHPSQGKAAAKPSSTQRMEKGKASPKSPSHTNSAGSGYGNGFGSSGGQVDGIEVAHRSRLLPSSWRKHRAQGKGRGAASGRWRIAIPFLSPDHQGRGDGTPGQSGSVRQLYPVEHPQDGISGGADPSSCQDPAEKRKAAIPVYISSISGQVSESRCRPGHSRVAPISAPTRRSIRRHQQRKSGLCTSEAKRPVAHRSECSQIHKGREDPAVVEQAISSKLAVLSLVERAHGSSDAGIADSPDALTKLGWINVLKLKRLPRRFSLEVFAGTGRITSAICKAGRDCFPIDICIDPSHNLLDIHVEHRILHLLDSGRVDSLWLGMPCTSFSTARKWDDLGPGPLRDMDNLHGFQWLTGTDLAKVRMGNSLLRVSLRLLAKCEERGIPYALENPMSSYAWYMPEVQRFLHKYNPQLVHLDYCQYGEPWRKPTTIMGNFWNLASLSKRCKSYKGVCSATSQQHVRLAGVDSNGVFMTLKAQPYPRAFAALVASLLANAND